MTRRVARPMLAVLLSLSLLPAVLAQGTPAAPPAAAETPPGAQPPAAPPYLLSLQDALRTSLENNLDITVRSYDPLQSESKVIASESFLDPFISGSATDKQDQFSGF